MADGTKLALLGIYLSIISHTLMYSTLFPIIGSILLDFKPLSTRSDLGSYYSKLNGGFFLGEFFCFPIQLYLCSKFGSRRLHLFSILSTLLFTLLISYSTTYDSLVTLRFLQGLCCPVIYSSLKLLKVYFPQKAENFIQRFYLVGLTIGFLIGGLMQGLVFMGSNQNLASNFIVIILAGISFVLCFKYGKEGEEGGQSSLLGIFIEIIEVFKVSGVFQTVGVYLLCCVAGAGFDIMILWMLANSELYGFNASVGDLTKVLFFSSFILFCFIFLFYKDIVSKLGYIQACKESLKFGAVSIFCIPIISIAHSSYTAMIFSISLGFILYLTSQFIAENTSFSLIGSLSNSNSGINIKDVSLALSKFIRSLSIYLFSHLFADHVNKKHYPSNFAYPFIIMTLILICTFFISFTLREADQSILTPKPRTDHDALLDPSIETLEIPVKNSELKVISSNK